MALGCIPTLDAVSYPLVLRVSALSSLVQKVDWIPVDAVSQLYLDLVLKPDSLPELINVVHPRPISWGTILQGIAQHARKNLNRVTFATWMDKIENITAADGEKDLQDIVRVLLSTSSRKLSLILG